MLRMTLVFLIVAMVAAVFGFGLLAAFTFDVAKILFFVFVALAAVTFLADSFRARPESMDPV